MNHIAENSKPTMSSREIAEVVESRHDNVKRTMESLQERGLIAFTQTEEKTAGRPAAVYHVNKRDSYVVVAQLSPEFTARLVDRWQELESANALPDFSNPVIAARAWADAKESEQQALAQLEASKPAVEFVERYVSADSGNNKGFRQVAKLLKANERELRAFLADHKIMYRLSGEWMPYQNHIDAGRFVVKTGVAENEHAFNTAKFTPKGINWLASLWNTSSMEGVA